MGLLDFFTGGKSGEASDALKRAEDYFANIQTPTQQELTLPELQKYVEAGLLTPAQAQSYLQGSNAYNDQNIDQAGTSAQRTALNQMAQVANAGAEGTPVEQAAIENAMQKMNTNVAGQRGAIEQQMAARGIPASLISAALQNQTVGQEAQQAHMDAVNAAGQNYQAALTAMSQGGALGGQLQGQQNSQANQVAAAQNAMQQFNAQNQQQNSQFNASNQQAANTANMANRQQVSNNNTGLANTRTQYNAALPQQVFNNNMSKAQGMAGAATNYGNLQNSQGQQNAGIWSGLINTATSFIPRPTGATPGGMQANGGTTDPYGQHNTENFAHGGYVDHDHSVCMAHGGYCMAEGGPVPGDAEFPGDTTMNDTVQANLSPGEAVIPRSSVAEHPDMVASLLGDQRQDTQAVDFKDVATLLKAMKAIRMGAA